jgi:hypothetical protein
MNRLILLLLFQLCVSTNTYSEDLKGEYDKSIKEQMDIKEAEKLINEICVMKKSIKRLLCGLDRNKAFSVGALGGFAGLQASTPIALSWYEDGVYACRIFYGGITGFADISDSFPKGLMNFNNNDKVSYQFDQNSNELYVKEYSDSKEENGAEVLRMNCEAINK